MSRAGLAVRFEDGAGLGGRRFSPGIVVEVVLPPGSTVVPFMLMLVVAPTVPPPSIPPGPMVVPPEAPVVTPTSPPPPSTTSVCRPRCRSRRSTGSRPFSRPSPTYTGGIVHEALLLLLHGAAAAYVVRAVGEISPAPEKAPCCTSRCAAGDGGDRDGAGEGRGCCNEDGGSNSGAGECRTCFCDSHSGQRSSAEGSSARSVTSTAVAQSNAASAANRHAVVVCI